MTDFALAETRAWVERAVIGLQLCPFAKAPQVRGQVRFVVSAASDAEALLGDLVDELNRLAAAPPERVETTLLIHPRVLADFEDHNDFLEIAEAALVALDLEGVIQIASFHPRYRFAGSAPDDIANATNRSPHPTLHLLREDSVERALASFADPAAIFEANIKTMTRLGREGWAALQRQCRDDAERERS
ncbi:MAG: DUF1415 domain-containing protein [Pseudomonadota bacterium]|nr:DUF1415 domain-containing protein [Pseudomonadota bacterium]